MIETPILAAGDEFVLPELFETALRPHVGDTRPIRRLSLDWPSVPFGPVAEVKEAAGTEQQIIEALEDVEVAVTHLAPITRHVLANAPSLKLVAVSRGGPVNVNLAAAAEHGVTVCFAPGRNAGAVAEFTIGLIIATGRNLVASTAAVADGTWHGRYFNHARSGSEIAGSRVGLIGYSAVGSLVGHLLTAFGATVSAYDPYVDVYGDGIRRVESLDELLSGSDIVSLHQRLTPKTRKMIGAPELAMMPTGSILINTARGGVLDYEALADALSSGHLGGAGLDVFDTEPVPSGSRLHRLPNVVMTPHIAGCSRQVADNAAAICATEVDRYLRGLPPANPARP